MALLSSCTKQARVLVLYYSQTGTTEAVAEEIQRQTGADICSIDVTDPYTGSFEETIKRCLEERNADYIPELNPLEINLDRYDVIFLGYPIWFGTYAPPVKALLKQDVIKGKIIVPFCTFGSGGLTESTRDLEKALPQCEIRHGYGVRSSRSCEAPEELNRFLIENGWKEGSIEPLPMYSEQKEVTEEEKAIFDAACSTYIYPLGTPVTVGSRPNGNGTDYEFTSEGQGMDGNKVFFTIYIKVTDGEDPVFTRVDR